MKILKCIICDGEVDILNEDTCSNKKVKCRKCGFTNANIKEKKEPEIFIIRKQS